MPYTLPKLNYTFDSLEPYFDARTLEIHYSKHHQTYVDKLNQALVDNNISDDKTIEELLGDLSQLPEKAIVPVENFGGGHFNHSFFWNILAKDSAFDPTCGVGLEIINTFGSFEEFKKQFTESAMKLFGSGWTWLVLDGGQLKIVNTSNQDCPLSFGHKPILVLDLWEHAYYLKFQNRRAEYIEAFWSVVDWGKVTVGGA